MHPHQIQWGGVGGWGYMFCLMLYRIAFLFRQISDLTYALLRISRAPSMIMRTLGILSDYFVALAIFSSRFSFGCV